MGNFVSGPWGAAWVAEHGVIVHEDRHGNHRHLKPPVPTRTPASIWVGPGVLVAAYAELGHTLSGAYRTQLWESRDAALVLFDLATGTSEEIGETIWFGDGPVSNSTIVGYDPTVPAVVLYRRRGRGRYDLPDTVLTFQKRDGTWYPPVPMAMR